MIEEEARGQLEAAGYRLLPHNWVRLPTPDHDVTETEMTLVKFLVYECDYPGFESRYMREGGAAFTAGTPSDAAPYRYEYDGGRPRLEWQWGWEIARSMAGGEG